MKNKVKENLKQIYYIEKQLEFFQNEEYIERMASIKSKSGYKNLLEYLAYKNIDGTTLIKMSINKITSKLIKKEVFHFNNVLNDRCVNCVDENTICILAPYHFNNLNDGYLNRIYFIDNTIFKNYKKVYLDYTDLQNKELIVDEFDDLHARIKFDSFNTKHLELVFDLIKKCHRLYIHSTHMTMPDAINVEFFKILNEKDIVSGIDVHGVAPEELEDMGMYNKASIISMMEQYITNRISYVVCVTQTMADYISNKTNTPLSKYIVLPIIPATFETKEEAKIRENKDKLDVVYAGGLQSWQNINLMKEVIAKTIDKYNHRVYVPDKNELTNMWKNDLEVSKVVIDSKLPKDLNAAYNECDLGFVLRDESIVNAVSCPTKLIEYIYYGIIPVVKSEDIGDFKRLGCIYIKYQDLIKGKIPSYKERIKIARNNKKVLEKIIKQAESSKKKLQSLFK